MVNKILKDIKYYSKIWFIMSKNSFLVVMSQGYIFSMFLLGKILRFSFFLTFIYFLITGSKTVAGYNFTQTTFFFLTFNLIDVISQFLFREVYRFRSLVVSGDLDLILSKPMSPLFRVLLGGVDLIDLITIPPLIVAVWYVGFLLSPGFPQVVFYILLIFSSLILTTSFHIFVLSMGILTLEIDHTIMIYRDLIKLGSLPVDVYKNPLNFILSYIIPIGIMFSLPAKVFMGVLSFKWMIVSFAFSITALYVSFRFWKTALKSYTSASS